MKVLAQGNLAGFIMKEDWATAREEWLDELVDVESGRRELRMALRRLRRTLYVELGRIWQRITISRSA
ncbi:hypothetical protein D1227_06350 [Henriciella mobilis]|uniref:hypothetical protein n=1 Tax=Henriciella mobilis TaxID=2305467 RepID=UPI000E664DB4|nr:hypothetical protein [Henriciella mobilis]RIJ15968.1 hypothetical protein D1231_09250 [Henriciella mobilis]RIJ21178.1 hypothetical protein D1227_12790 [Henriciella mobilis]RIJ23121.1 hypothetical protein D1227_06350 [Henriciella mobilis]